MVEVQKKLEEIYKVVKEMQKNQSDQLVKMQENQKHIEEKIDKLQEYNEIDDMNNALIDRNFKEIKQKLN